MAVREPLDLAERIILLRRYAQAKTLVERAEKEADVPPAARDLYAAVQERRLTEDAAANE